jgi:hypothetical protein
MCGAVHEGLDGDGSHRLELCLLQLQESQLLKQLLLLLL